MNPISLKLNSSKIFEIIINQQQNIEKNYTFNYSFRLFSLLVITAFFLIEFLKPLLSTSSFALGPHTISLFIPVTFSLIFYSYFFISNNLEAKNIFFVFGLFLILLAPFYNHFFSPITHIVGDDSVRYSLSAHNMVAEGTLWGGDGLLINQNSPFLLQVGIRYYLALTIKIFGGEYRINQIFGMLIYLSTIIYTLDTIKKNSDTIVSAAALIFGLASAPFVIKNILHTMSEWAAVCLFAMVLVSCINKRYHLASFFLALCFVFRSNLAIFVLLFFLFHIDKKSWSTTGVFFMIFLLPLFHNLYYAGEWRLLGSSGGFSIMNEGEIIPSPAMALMHKLLHFLGYCRSITSFSSFIIGFVFVPFGYLLILYNLVQAYKLKKGFILLFILTGSIIGPTVIFGSLSYPRFEFVNLGVSLMLCYLTWHKAKEVRVT